MIAANERSYNRFAIYRLTERWRQLDTSTRSGSLAEFAACLEEPSTDWQQCYSLIGLRADADFCIWLKSDAGIGPLQTFERRLRATAFGGYIELTHNFISITKPSPYARPETDAERLKLHAWPDGAPYLFFYPYGKIARLVCAQGRGARTHHARAHCCRAEVSANPNQHEL